MSRIVFFGTPEFAVPALHVLQAAHFEIVAVVTAPDKPVGRKKVLTPPPVKQWAAERHIPVLQPTTLKDDAFFEQFSALKPEVCVVAAYGKIIPQRYLDVPPKGFVNIHPSLLPAYRGPSPIKAAILDGCANTGVTIMQVDAEMDHGPILAQQVYAIASDVYFLQIEKELSEIGANLLVKTLQSSRQPAPQNHSEATFTKKFTREDGRIDWQQSPVQIYNQIRALADEPGMWTIWKDKILNVRKAHLENDSLVLDEVQLEGSKPMSLTSFKNGHPDFSISDLHKN